MKFVADKAIPFLEGLFDPYGVEVVFKDGRAIAREDLMDAEVLITRTRTRCDARLLEGTGIRMIATATIGTDHIDLPWCAEHGIAIASAPGCNAGGVIAAVFQLRQTVQKDRRSLPTAKISYDTTHNKTSRNQLQFKRSSAPFSYLSILFSKLQRESLCGTISPSAG